MKKIFCFSIAILFASCGLDNDYIRQREWKYGDGFWLKHDFIAFGGGYMQLKNDTIYVGDSAVCTIYETEKGYFGKDNEIHIKSIKTNRTGIYHDFGPVTTQDTTTQIILTPPPKVDEPPPPPPPPPPKN